LCPFVCEEATRSIAGTTLLGRYLRLTEPHGCRGGEQTGKTSAATSDRARMPALPPAGRVRSKIAIVVCLFQFLPDRGGQLFLKFGMRFHEAQDVSHIFLPLAGTALLVLIGPEFALKHILE